MASFQICSYFDHVIRNMVLLLAAQEKVAQSEIPYERMHACL